MTSTVSKERKSNQAQSCETLVIRISGDSGDGIQLLGEQLTITAALSGRDVRTLPDFPAEIRAPAGTVAGVSGFQLAMSEVPLYTAGDSLDVLVAFNPASLKHALSALKPGGLLLMNEDHFQDKDWQKAGLSPENFEKKWSEFQCISFPWISQTLASIEALKAQSPELDASLKDLSHTQAKKAKNFYVLGVILWLFDLPMQPCINFIQKKFRNAQALQEINQASLKAGYDYAMTLELARQSSALGVTLREPGEYRQVTGVEATSLAIAALAVGCQQAVLVSGYPITPASAILHECAKLAEFGVHLFQAEDEIAAICACLGAAFGGNLAITCTSGPGFDLKTEGLGLGVVTELPLVVINVQRAGASTGLPTKTSQSDLQHALFGRHGEAPLPVIAAKSPADCFDTLLTAARMAVQAMTPVIVLLDAYLANAAEPWKIPAVEDLSLPMIQHNRFAKPFERDERLVRSWNRPGSPDHIHQLGGLEKQGAEGRVSYDADNHQIMVRLRDQKIKRLAEDYPPLFIEGDSEASTLIIAWGSTYGAIKSAVETLCQSGHPIAYLHLRHLFPLPCDLEAHLKSYKKIIVAELNSGHLWQCLRAQYLVDAELISQINGQAFSVSQLIATVIARLETRL